MWFVWPKGNRADINRDSIWGPVQDVGWILDADVSVSDTWSAVRARPAD